MSHSCWIRLADSTTQHNQTLWYWVPGWSFKADVFLPLIEHLPGRHMGLCYDSLLAQSDSFQDAVQQLIQQSEDHAHWVGWSLGGALAAMAAPAKAPLQLHTLATGQTFLQRDTDQSGFGMPAATLDLFEQGLQAQTAKTLKRFLGLCTAGCAGGREEMRQLMRQLGEHQLGNPHTLVQTLDWLRQFQLPDTLADDSQRGMAFYANADALNPGGLTPAIEMTGSHAFWLEQNNLPTLIERLQEGANAL